MSVPVKSGAGLPTTASARETNGRKQRAVRQINAFLIIDYSPWLMFFDGKNFRPTLRWRDCRSLHRRPDRAHRGQYPGSARTPPAEQSALAWGPWDTQALMGPRRERSVSIPG